MEVKGLGRDEIRWRMQRISRELEMERPELAVELLNLADDLKIRRFRVCDKCSTTSMCTQEEHCDRVSNEYR